MLSSSRAVLVTVALASAVLLVGCGAEPEAGSLDTAAEASEPVETDEPGSSETALLASDQVRPRLPAARPAPSTATSPTPTPSPSPVEPSTPAASSSEPAASSSEPAPSNRIVAEVAWTPFATIGDLVLHHPSARVERIGFHEATHDGARQMAVAGSAVRPMTLQTRGRGTGSRSAADIVVDPAVQIRSPVTGTVLRAGSYVLYCDYSDGYVVVEPDGWPGWEAKVLHIDQVHVSSGDRVVAGETVIATRPTPLPFESQVDKHTAEPSWPHVHIEVVDTSIPRKPSSGGGC